MKLTDIMPLEKWVELEKEINKRFGLNASVFDVDGLRITKFVSWANRLCPAIKATSKGQTFICSAAHQNIAKQAEQTGKSVVAECDAGLSKIIAPIFYKDEFLGAVGGCGLFLEGGEIDSFLVYKTTDIAEKEVEELSNDIGTISDSDVKSLTNFLEERLDTIVGNN